MSKTAVLDRDSAAPSSPAPTADRVRATESPFPAILNGLLQQNRNGPAVLLPRRQANLARGAKVEEHAMSQQLSTTIDVIGVDIGKNAFHIVGLDHWNIFGRRGGTRDRFGFFTVLWIRHRRDARP